MCFWFLISYMLRLYMHINPILDGETKSPTHSTSFSPVTSTNVEISPQNFRYTGTKFQVCTQCQSLLIEPKPPLKKCGFSGQILMKFRFW